MKKNELLEKGWFWLCDRSMGVLDKDINATVKFTQGHLYRVCENGFIEDNFGEKTEISEYNLGRYFSRRIPENLVFKKEDGTYTFI